MRTELRAAACAAAIGIAAAFLPFDWAGKIASNLVAVFAILAGLLAQIIALTAVIMEPGRLSAERVNEIGAALRDLQRRNRVLFFFYLATAALFLAVQVIDGQPHIVHFGAFGFTIGRALLFACGFMVVICVVRTNTTLRNIGTLQETRVAAQAEEAAAREKRERAASAVRLVAVPDQGGASYGGAVAPKRSVV